MSQAKVVRVIQTSSCMGVGTLERPYWTCTEYWSLDGELLWESANPYEGSEVRVAAEKLEKQKEGKS